VVVTGKRHLFDPTVNARFFKGFERRGLSVAQTGLDAALGENPSTTAGSHEQEFWSSGADAIANRRNLLATAQVTCARSDKSRSQPFLRNG